MSEIIDSKYKDNDQKESSFVVVADFHEVVKKLEERLEALEKTLTKLIEAIYGSAKE